MTFYTIIDERRCPVCASRHGLIIPLDNWRAIAQITPPLHPNCRCVLSPVLKDDPRLDEPDRKIENRELIPRPVLWAGAAVLAAVLFVRFTPVLFILSFHHLGARCNEKMP